ncbi:FtsW/RodA/SpoVE family cell cycle protein [Ornithinibacillus scapharcae]|uniref:FtsW/RodA/SpoVE family cell cycle protein n=1 Tax=Ornithinibacillus scapharcae TaxID=1147159 RepID=UPI000225B3BD|nr:FtsW/RodA/SpoVE family cell cycle protein [Ornithinibacillus scapharcae]
MTPNKFEDFLNKVTSRVRSKEAHSMIRKELNHHLQELSKTYQNDGLTGEDMEEKVLKEMGNPYALGDNLNRIHKPKMDWLLIVMFVIIAGIGFLPLINEIPGFPGAGTHFIHNKIIGNILAILVVIGILFFDYRKLNRYSFGFYGLAILLHLYTAFFGYNVNGTQRWISVFGIFSDVTIITLCLFFLAWAGLLRNINKYDHWIKQLALVFLFWVPIIIYMVVPSMMSALIYFICILTMFAFSSVQKQLALKMFLWNVIGGVLLLVTVVLPLFRNVFHSRLAYFLSPESDPDGGYIYIALKDVLSNAGWFGNGFESQLMTLPATHTDLVFPYLIYTLGWAFGIALCILLLMFIFRISANAFKTKDLFGRLIVIGGAALFIVPTLWNILMGLGIIPIVGVPIPIISYGTSYLVIYSIVLGLVLNVYRRKDIIEPTIVVK